jgi:hypothetical protein
MTGAWDAPIYVTLGLTADGERDNSGDRCNARSPCDRAGFSSCPTSGPSVSPVLGRPVRRTAG